MLKKILLVSFIIAFTISCKKDRSSTQSNSKLLFAKVGEKPGLFDQQDRYVILRGANYNVLGDYWIANPDVATVKKYSEDDFKIMASYGFNCIRLVFNWSKLEPTRGQYNQSYIDAIKQAIEAAAKYNIYVLVDMHQDAYSKFIYTKADESCEYPLNGWDGAPEWAVITDGASTCMGNSNGVGGRETSKAVITAFQNFWDNINGIQDNCINAWAHLVKQIGNYENVLGYDMLNEPSLGYKDLIGEAVKLGNFYDRLGHKIRATERENKLLEHTLFFEMSISWNGQQVPFVPSTNFTQLDNICFAPHSYFEAISFIFTVEQGYDLLKSFASGYNTGLFMGEYGFFEDSTTGVPKLIRFAKHEDKYFNSSTIWSWSQAPGDPHVINFTGTVYPEKEIILTEVDKHGNSTGKLNTAFLEILGRTRPNAIVGYPTFLESDPLTGKMRLKAESNQSGTTILWIPNRFGTPIISGKNIKRYHLTEVDGGYLADIDVEKNYEIAVDF